MEARDQNGHGGGKGPAGPRKPGVLAVDDDASVRAVVVAGLRHEGFEVWLAADGREALEIYQRHRATIDVVLLDVRMPSLDGPQTLAALRKLNPGVCCCFMSGDPGSYSPDDLLRLGAAQLFRKPFQLAEVASGLRRLAVQPEACLKKIRA